MDQIPFLKMSGSGNDFIIIDNRESIISLTDKALQKFVEQVCRRKMSVGADGFILIEEDPELNFKWQFYNSDGSRAEMCGNGARCAAQFAYLYKIAPHTMSFRTDAGVLSAEINGNRVKISMPNPTSIIKEQILERPKGSFVAASANTGVPHVVIPVKNLESTDVFEIGREIRYSKAFSPAGTNVNFISKTNDGVIHIRTYERGIEGETLACGTGSVAAALLFSKAFGISPPVPVKTRGGILNIYFKEDNNNFSNVFLEGDARVIYEGKLTKESWEYE